MCLLYLPHSVGSLLVRPSVVASSKDVYQLRFYNIQAGEDEEEE